MLLRLKTIVFSPFFLAFWGKIGGEKPVFSPLIPQHSDSLWFIQIAHILRICVELHACLQRSQARKHVCKNLSNTIVDFPMQIMYLLPSPSGRGRGRGFNLNEFPHQSHWVCPPISMSLHPKVNEFRMVDDFVSFHIGNLIGIIRWRVKIKAINP